VALAFAACVLIVVGPDLLVRFQADQTTSTAEVRSIGLDDGSVVRLAPDSAVDIAYEAGRRRVRLLQGEAFFEVRPDPARPFMVEARGVQTTVLGTSFNVRTSGDGAEVAVQSGLVRVDAAAAQPPVTLRLEPGEWAQVARSDVVARGRVPTDEVAPWLGGQIVARDRPMADVVDDLRRYFAGSIVLVDADLAARRVTGVYNLADPVGALRAIVGAHGGSVRQVSPWLLLAF
jgi:transmembrane sensor